jgi:hypothetical protein
MENGKFDPVIRYGKHRHGLFSVPLTAGFKEAFSYYLSLTGRDWLRVQINIEHIAQLLFCI